MSSTTRAARGRRNDVTTADDGTSVGTMESALRSRFWENLTGSAVSHCACSPAEHLQQIWAETGFSNEHNLHAQPQGGAGRVAPHAAHHTVDM